MSICPLGAYRYEIQQHSFLKNYSWQILKPRDDWDT